jgi:RimJ/RimL family protein N-acetyltransferase
MLTWSGRWRDSVYFSIIDEEWPAVKRALEGKLAG